MCYSAFVFSMCLVIWSAVCTESKGIHVSGYKATSAIYDNRTVVQYQFEKSEVLNLTCHNIKKKAVIWLRWLHNDQIIPGTADSSKDSKLLFNITESNDKDRLTCYAFEDSTGLKKKEKKYTETVTFLLDYVRREGATTSEPHEGNNEEGNTDSESWFDGLSPSMLLWTGLVVAVVLVILAALVIVASKRNYSMKEDKVSLHPAASNASVFSTVPKTSTAPRITERNLYTNDRFYNNTQLHASHEIINSEYQEPIDSQAYCEPQTYCEPDRPVYAEPIPRTQRPQKDNVYVNYNTSSDSVNISNENMDLYENCANICDDEFIYYTETN